MDCELDYQDRETVMWTEKFKAVGSRALGDKGRGSGEVDERVIVRATLPTTLPVS